MKHVAVIGGGPAGAFAAERLASAGIRTTVIDEKLAWEKPCGGGLTYKAYSTYPFLLDNPAAKREVRDTYLAAPRAGTARLQLNRPLLVYSRLVFNRMLLERAEQAGAQLEQTRVTDVQPKDGGWRLKTPHGILESDFVIVATGARNGLRTVGRQWRPEDTMYALGYYVSSRQEHIDIQFLKGMEGYIWVFPRCDHLAVGICGRGLPAREMRRRLEAYMEEKGLSWKHAQFYGHLIPSLGSTSWKTNQVAGDGWMAVGDAAGLVDPVTGEGIYYALRSADLASRSLIADTHPRSEVGQVYQNLVTQEIGRELEYGAHLAPRLFLRAFLFGTMPERMIQFMRYSQRFCEVMQDLFAGTQPYLELKQRLLRNLNGTIAEVIMSFLMSKFVPSSGRL